jgi:hypothetical protein
MYRMGGLHLGFDVPDTEPLAADQGFRSFARKLIRSIPSPFYFLSLDSDSLKLLFLCTLENLEIEWRTGDTFARLSANSEEYSALFTEDGIRTSTGHHLNAAFLVHLGGEAVTLKLPLDGFADGVEAFYKGTPIPELFIIEGNEQLASDIADARLQQTKALKKIRKTLRKALKLAPPFKTDAVDVKAQREAGKASSKKQKGSESSHDDIPELPTEAE